MPPIQQQSSRAGLISTIVVLVVLLVGTLIWAFYANTQFNQRDAALNELTLKYSKVVKDTDLSAAPDTETAILKHFKADRNIPGTLMDAATVERRKLFELISGSDQTDVTAGIKAANDNVAAAIDKLQKAKLTDLNTSQPLPLVSTIDDLAKALTEKQQALEDAVKARDTAVAAAKDAAAAQAQALKQRDDAVAQQTQRAKEAEDKLAAFNSTIEGSVAKMTTDQQAQINDMSQKQAQLQAQIAQLNGVIVRLTGENKVLVEKIAKVRPSVVDVMIRRSGVHILRVENANTVYIDAGFADRVNPGLTFEVYGKTEGIPKLGDGMSDENLPEGKASIEVVKVGENSSEARVVRNTSGDPVSEGDICANISYDRAVKPAFMVYGNFDMDFNGVWTAGEADVVKSLVKRFGGVVVDKISIDTDFLVLGKEPEVPTLTAEEKNDPILIAKQDAAKVALKAYEDVRNQAAEFHIPVLNQSRFLYYTGYFDLAKR